MKELIEEAGRLLYGEDWLNQLCRDAAWSKRFMTRILNGQNEAPDYVFYVLADHASARAAVIREHALDAGPTDLRHKLNAVAEEYEDMEEKLRECAVRCAEPQAAVR